MERYEALLLLSLKLNFGFASLVPQVAQITAQTLYHVAMLRARDLCIVAFLLRHSVRERLLAVDRHFYDVIVRVVRRVQLHELCCISWVLYPIVHVQAVHLALVNILLVRLGQVGSVRNDVEDLLLLPSDV